MMAISEWWLSACASCQLNCFCVFQ